MENSAFQFLKVLLHSPSPSGYEQPVQKVVREFSRKFADEVNTDWHGNVVATVNPNGSPRIMLAGHCDQIGLMVKHVDDDGFVRVTLIGGWDIQMLIGQNVVIWTEAGPIPGVIARKAIHLLTQDEQKIVPEIKDLWIDIAAKDRSEARELVNPGDPVTIKLGFCTLRNELVSAPGMDNKVGTWVVMNALKQVSEGNPKAAVFAVSTVQEEIGLRGARTSAFSIDPQLGIAVDVTHATDCPTIDENQHGQVKLGDGPVVYRGPNINPVVYKTLIELSRTHNIPVQPNGLSKPAANDANALQISRGGIATGLVAIPNRYMHSPVEVVSLTDLQYAAALIAQFCVTVDEESDFTPGI